LRSAEASHLRRNPSRVEAPDRQGNRKLKKAVTARGVWLRRIRTEPIEHSGYDRVVGVDAANKTVQLLVGEELLCVEISGDRDGWQAGTVERYALQADVTMKLALCRSIPVAVASDDVALKADADFWRVFPRPMKTDPTVHEAAR
jgi:hypothetical protein